MKEMKELLTKIDTVFKTEKKKISLIHYLQQDLPNYNIKITNHSNLIGSDYWKHKKNIICFLEETITNLQEILNEIKGD